MWMVDPNQPFGAKIHNTSFSKFANQGCKGFVMNWSHDSRGYFDYTTLFSGTNVEPGTPLVDMCLARSSGINEIVVTDLDSSLDPVGLGSGVSSLISDDENLMVMLNKTKCTPIASACAQYCRDACLRSFTIAIDNGGTEDIQLELYSDDNAATLNSTFEVGNDYENTWYQRYRYFSASLPAGSYNARFIQNGSIVDVWPKLVQLTEGKEPGCTTYYDNLALEVPTMTFETCRDLIENGGIENGIAPWHHSGGGLDLIQGAGVNGSQAISSVNRESYWDSLGQFIDMNCIHFMANMSYEINAKVRMFDEDSGEPYPCDADVVNTQWESCPRFTLKLDDPPTSARFLYFAHAVRSVGDPMERSGYNLIGNGTNQWIDLHGIFKVNHQMLNSRNIFGYVERVKPGVGLIIDDVSIKAMVIPGESNDLECSNLVHNGDFEVGTSHYWGIYNGGKIGVIEENGNHALRSYNRGTKAHGPRQDLVQACMQTGVTYTVYADVKLTDTNGATWYCDPTINWGNECPKARLKIKKEGQNDQYIDIGTASTWDNEWNAVTGAFGFSRQMIDADVTSLVFEKADINIDMLIDNVSISLA